MQTIAPILFIESTFYQPPFCQTEENKIHFIYAKFEALFKSSSSKYGYND